MTSADRPQTEPADMSPFERSLSIYNQIYDDDIASMKDGLPELVELCGRLGETTLGKNYADLRLPAFVLASNKLEGTLSPNASEGDTFKVIYDFLQSESPSKAHIHHIPWDDEGQNESNEAWYAQCMAHTEALKMMVGLAREGKPLDPDILLDCHNILMSGAVTASGEEFESRFRGFDEPVLAGNYVFPNLTDHKNDLAQKLEQLNAEFQTSHPVAWASDLMLAVLTLHPFLNGNGRLARLCFAYGLMRHAVPCAVVFSDWHSKAHYHYIRAVQEAQGQKGGKNKYEKLYSMAITGLYQTLRNMRTFCKYNGTDSL